MEIFVIIILLLIFFLIISGQIKRTENKIDNVDKKINALYKEIVKNKVSPQPVKETIKEEIKPTPKEEVKPKLEDLPYVVTEKPKEEILSKEEAKLEEELEKMSSPKPVESIAKKEEVITKIPVDEVKEIIPQKPKEKSDLESIVGENILNKIGIAVLILGIGFFVKYAIDKEYINELGRVLIGVASSGILLTFAYFLKKSYRAFSSVLAGGAIAVLYYSVTVAYQDYGLLSQPVAFVSTILITGFATFLAVKFNRKELAIIGLIGGFTSPFMVSGESNNYIAFFTYISVLNLGMLALAYFKKWRIINLLAYIFTILLFGGWLTTEYNNLKNITAPALTFATIFYVIFYGANLIYTLRKREKFEAGQFISLLSTTVMYFSAGMFILNFKEFNYQGIFAISLAGVNLLLALFVFKNKTIDKNLFYLILSKAIVLVTLFAPIQLNGNYITIFWLIETSTLIWLSQRTQMKVFKDITAIVFLVACFSLLINLLRFYLIDFKDSNNPILNQGFITGMVAIVTYLASIYLLKREEDKNTYLFFSAKGFGKTLKIVAGVVGYLSVLFELNYGINYKTIGMAEEYSLFDFSRAGDSIQVLVNYGYHFIVIGAFIFFTRKSNDSLIKVFSLVGLAIITLLYLLAGNQSGIYLRKYVLTGEVSSAWLVLRYAVTVLMIIANALFFFTYIKGKAKTEELSTFFYIITVFFAIYTISVELDFIAVLSQIDVGSTSAEISSITKKTLNFTQKAGYSIAWGLSSFVFMFIGMKSKITILRILSLVLFLITLIKLLVFDMHNMSNVARYISFIGLGILLLIVSFMYQRLRKLINEGK